MSAFQNCLVLMPHSEVASEQWFPKSVIGEVHNALMVTVCRAGQDVLVNIEVTDADGTTVRKQIVVLAAATEVT